MLMNAVYITIVTVVVVAYISKVIVIVVIVFARSQQFCRSAGRIDEIKGLRITNGFLNFTIDKIGCIETMIRRHVRH